MFWLSTFFAIDNVVYCNSFYSSYYNQRNRDPFYPPTLSVYAHTALWVSHVKIFRSQLFWNKVVSWWQTNRSWIFTMLHSVYVWVHLSTVWPVRDLDGSWRVTNLLKSKSSNLIFDFFFVISQTQQISTYIFTWVNLLVPFKLVHAKTKERCISCTPFISPNLPLQPVKADGQTGGRWSHFKFFPSMGFHFL